MVQYDSTKVKFHEEGRQSLLRTVVKLRRRMVVGSTNNDSRSLNGGRVPEECRSRSTKNAAQKRWQGVHYVSCLDFSEGFVCLSPGIGGYHHRPSVG
jgi:hypothetical protein